MKKLTKKAIANAPKYMISIDYRACYKPMTIDYRMIEAENILDAMRIADKFFDKETVYLMTIMEKTGEVQDNEFLVYEDKLTSRNRGNWHLTDAEHSEQPFTKTYHVESDTIC